MKNLTIVGQLGVGFGLLLVVLVMTLVLAVHKQHELAEFTFRQYEHPFTVSNAVARADANAARARRVLGDIVLAQSGDEISELSTELQRLNSLVLDDLTLAKARFLGSKTDFDRLISLHESSKPLWAQIVEAKKQGNGAEALRLMHAEGRTLTETLHSAHSKVYDFALSKAAAFQDSARQSRDNAVTLTVGIGAFAVLLGVAAAVYCTRLLARPIAEAVEVARAVAAGDLSKAKRVQGNNETSRLLRALHDMQQSLSDVVVTVRRGAQGVVSASAQISQGNQDLSARTEHQASALEETASTMEELGSSARLTADNAHHANELAQGASRVANEGGRVVQEVVATMNEISASSKRIADIIAVIDGIAFQTNILALNASVEAARAGEQGRGFAVVAGEVRSLAQRAAEAASEIRGLIVSSVERMENGSVLAQRAGNTMTEVVGAIHRVSDIVGEISAAAAQQSAGVGEVGAAVATLDETTQHNATLVQQSASAADSLRDQAERLVAAVAVFQVPVPVEYLTQVAPAPAPATAAATPERRPLEDPSPTATEHAEPVRAEPATANLTAKVKIAVDENDWQSF